MKNRRVKYRVFFLQVVRGIVNRLFSRKALWQSDPEKISKFLLLKAREQWRAHNAVNDRVFIHFSCCCCGLFNEQSSARVMKCTSSIICDAWAIFYHLHNFKSLKNGTKSRNARHVYVNCITRSEVIYMKVQNLPFFSISSTREAF